MKKRITFICLTAAMIFSVANTAHSQTTTPCLHYFKLGYGIFQSLTISDFNSGFDGGSPYLKNSSLLGPLYFKYDYNVDYNLTIGISAAYEKNKFDSINYYI